MALKVAEARWGADFSRNIGTNTEIHGGWARFTTEYGEKAVETRAEPRIRYFF